MEIPSPIVRHGGTAASLGSMGSSPGIAQQPYVTARRDTPAPSRFALVSRIGQYWSYPYSYVGLVECLSPDLITVFCNCEKIAKIEIRGHGLDDIAVAITNQNLLVVTESDHAEFVQSGVVVIEIRIEEKESAQKK